MAKTLEVTFRANTQQFTKGIGKMNSALIHLQNNVNKVNGTTAQVVNATNKATTAEQKAAEGANQWSNATKNVNSNLRKSGTLVDGIAQKLRMLASTYLGVMGAKALISTSDAMTGAENKLNYVNAQTMGNDLGYTTGVSGEKTFSNATLDATASTMEKIFRISQQARTGYTDMVANVSKSMMLAGDAFGNNVDNAIRFQQIMAEAYTVGGASAAEQASSMYQMVQALGAGVLAGDELRSVREGAPLAYKAIEEFAQGVYNTTDSLKDMASEGMITSDIVVAGIMTAGDKLDEAFQSTTMTFGQMWQIMKSSATHSFMPVFDEMRKQMTLLTKNGFFDNFTKIMEGVATVATYIVRAIGTALNIINNNWYWLKYVALGVFVAIALAAASSALSVLKSFASLVGGASPFMKIAMAIGAIAALMQLVMGKNAEMAQVLMATALLVSTFLMIRAAATASTVVGFIAGAVMAIVLLIFTIVMMTSDSVEDGIGRIIGGITAAISVIWNLLITFVALVLKSAILPITNAIDTLANFIGNVFKDPIASVIRLFESMGNTVLSILRTVANGIDSIFGTNLSSSIVGSLQGKWSGLADRLVDKYGNGTYQKKSEASKAVSDLIDGLQTKYSWNTSDAYQSGYNWGSNATTKIKDKLSGLANVGSLGDTSNLNLNTDSIEDISKGVGNLDDTTGKISDKLDTTIEDLQYLRDLAELEWKKEYTVASINVDMTNNNTVNGDSDLDGIVTKLSDMLYQELNEVAEGVYTM